MNPEEDRVMNPQNPQHSGAWVVFAYASFVGSVAMLAIGLLFAPIEIWMKGYFAMGIAMLIQSCITATKTIRDVHEANKLLNRIDEARTEKLLMGAEKA
jgi:hypothetical protein